MTKKSMKLALTNSLKAEDEAVRSRFEKAERLLEEKTEPNSSQLTTSQPQDIVEPAQLQKVIRDSFTLPSGDYELITTIRQRCLMSAVNVTKSEVIRAGLHILQSLSDEELVQAINSLEKVKTGRPSGKEQKL
ncbi:hypothetical protein LC593_23590 [Nostoc sp. CHAB 5844]|nr:hypothetical protein [Nostoc sp. CHAB 5844]